MTEEDRARAARIEQKLDILIAALADEDEEQGEPSLTLDGQPAGGERDTLMPLTLPRFTETL